jgi:hypothetical protein
MMPGSFQRVLPQWEGLLVSRGHHILQVKLDMIWGEYGFDDIKGRKRAWLQKVCIAPIS